MIANARWQDLAAAAALLTRLPFRAGVRTEHAPTTGALWALPLIGALIGALGGGAFWLAASLGLPAAIGAILAVATTVLLTGALHEDGLADTADGFGGGHDRDRKLAIMRDSAVGTYGVLALLLSALLRIACLAALLSPGLIIAALIGAHALSRGLLPLIMATMPLAREDGLAAGIGRPTRKLASASLAIAAAIALPALGLESGVLALSGAALVAWLLARLARAQIGGYTGDVLGAVQQGVEIVVLVIVVTGQ